ncbi:uncharacterized protein LOC123275134 [Cotesia glomerata]|uniref:uncharacterized protein LOC123275134 n=1 Tax=Cotesia glomerata TaxID=32391 RepID=UPI001D02C8E3|nr:uncharacterized protein LOC123275134 [Cotesia glomerata]
MVKSPVTSDWLKPSHLIRKLFLKEWPEVEFGGRDESGVSKVQQNVVASFVHVKQLLNNQNRCSDISVNVTDVINDHSQQQNSVPTGYNLVNNDYNPPVDVQPEIPYSRFRRNKFAHKEFNDKFLNNMFGHKCSVCDRLWFKLDLKSPRAEDEQLLRVIVENYNTVEDILLCNTCYQAIGRKVIPIMSTYNGFKYEKYLRFYHRLT